jgi:hypothetical protein
METVLGSSTKRKFVIFVGNLIPENPYDHNQIPYLCLLAKGRTGREAPNNQIIPIYQ